MKHLVTVLLNIYCILLSLAVFSQNGGVSISPTNTTADQSAILDVNSDNKGFLLPRMTTSQRNAISNPALGLQIFNTTTNCLNIWLGATWKQICGDCDFNNPVSGNNGPICAGQTLNLSATTISGASYQWTGPNGFTSTDQNPSIPNAIIAASGPYSVTATLNGCTSSPQTTVATVNAIPQTPVASNDGPLCPGQTLSLYSSTVSGASYNWTGPNNFAANSQNPIRMNIQSVDAGTYNVVASVSGCNSALGSTLLTVNLIPDAPGSISGSASVSSYSSGNVYSISAVSGATSYSWTVPTGASITAGAGTTSIAVAFGSAGVGNITVASSNICGTSSFSSLSISINPAVTLFTNVGTTLWTPPSGVTSVEVLVVAGGGGGGGGNGSTGAHYSGGGGGGGGVVFNASYTVSGATLVTVGDGGAGHPVGNGDNGQNSSFGTLTAIAGGGGGQYGTAGNNGGSGGGGGRDGGTPGSGTPGQGSDGGPTGGDGGGGAGETGGTDQPGYQGGDGLQYSISGTPTYYGGGGGGAQMSGSPNYGGDGGGGLGNNEVVGTPGPGGNGQPNTGGGGGGSGNGYSAGSGGSGIVIIRY